MSATAARTIGCIVQRDRLGYKSKFHPRNARPFIINHSKGFEIFMRTMDLN